MQDSYPTIILLGIVASIVVLWFGYLWLFDEETSIKPGLSRYKLLTGKVNMNKAPKLCPYHISVTLRPGQLAMLAKSDCELCAKEKVVHLRK